VVDGFIKYALSVSCNFRNFFHKYTIKLSCRYSFCGFVLFYPWHSINASDKL